MFFFRTNLVIAKFRQNDFINKKQSNNGILNHINPTYTIKQFPSGMLN